MNPPALQLDLLIQEMALRTNQSRQTIIRKLADHLQISTHRLYAIRKADKYKVISYDKLILISNFFECKIDDLINPQI